MLFHTEHHTCCSAAFLAVASCQLTIGYHFHFYRVPGTFRSLTLFLKLRESVYPCRSIGRANEGSMLASVWQWPSGQAIRTFAHVLSRWHGNGSTSRNSTNGTIGKR